MLLTSRCQFRHKFEYSFWFLWLLLNAHEAYCVGVHFVYRCASGFYGLLCVSEEPGIQDTMFPMWPFNMFFLYPTVLQLFQPLLLCLHYHRVSQIDEKKILNIFFSFWFPNGFSILMQRYISILYQLLLELKCLSVLVIFDSIRMAFVTFF